MSVRRGLMRVVLAGLICGLLLGSLLARPAEAFEPPIQPERTRAQVLEVVDDEEVQEGAWGLPMRRQTVTLRVLGGRYRDMTFTVSNYLSGQPGYDLVLEPGDRVLVSIEEGEAEEPAVFIEDFARDTYLYGLAGLFAVTLVAMGGRKGLKALLALVLTIAAIFFLLLPRLLAGYPPVGTTVALCALITLATMVMVAGPTRKALAATLGTTGGLAVAGALAMYGGTLAQLMGMSAQEAQFLYFVDDLQLDFRGLLFSGMILGALGAIMDVAMSIASAIEEVRRANAALSPIALFRSGMNVGRDVMGTMANTLILAYTGGALPLLLLLMVHDASLVKVINLDLIATEVVRALAGSVGVVLCVPITAALASVVFSPAARRRSARTRVAARRA